MSKHGWTYKKLGDVAEIVGGSTPKTSNPDFWGGEHYWVTPAELGDFVYINKTERTITDEALAKTNLTLLPVGTVLLSSRAPIGKTAITAVPMYCNQGFKNIICSKVLNNKFVYYYINRIVPKLQSLGRGATFKEISKSIVESTTIPVPGMAEQEAIVAELDEINEAIAALQQQVADLDTLAQATFYDMFGDPVTNPKAWPVIQLGDKCEVTSFKRVLIEDVVESGIPFIRGTELGALSKLAKGQSIEFSLFITSEHYEKVKAISGVPKIGDLLIPSINSDGNIWILDTNAPMYFKDGRVLWIHVNHDTYTSESLKYIVSYLIRNTYSQMASGATFAELKLFILRELKTILPPLPLQQEFAEKVEAIESAKAELNAQIAEMQTLLASRMDYYFD